MKKAGTAMRVPERSGSTSCIFSQPDEKTTALPLVGESGVSTRSAATPGAAAGDGSLKWKVPPSKSSCWLVR